MTTIAERLLAQGTRGWGATDIDEPELKAAVLARLVGLAEKAAGDEKERARWSGESVIRFNWPLDEPLRADVVRFVVERGFEGGTYRVLYVTPATRGIAENDWYGTKQASFVFTQAEIAPLFAAMDATGLSDDLETRRIIAEVKRRTEFANAFGEVDPIQSSGFE